MFEWNSVSHWLNEGLNEIALRMHSSVLEEFCHYKVPALHVGREGGI